MHVGKQTHVNVIFSNTHELFSHVIGCIIYIHTEPAGIPPELRTVSVTSSNITITWGKIECSLQNGHITGYDIRVYCLSVLLSTIRVQSVGVRTYTANSLSPNREYGFRVAAVNDAGVGEFTQQLTVTTDDK